MTRLAEASDVEFDKRWAETKEERHDPKGHMSSGRRKFSHAVNDLFD